ncbi:MAG: sigma-54 dependent transcriptional regulator [Marinobacter sp.]|nr:sigma-54 dependent transcriptional regulator [Marinobacter sp.]
MEQNRPLVWLSADMRQTETSLYIGSQWQLTRVHPGQPPLSRQTHWDRKPIGVCELASLAPDQFGYTSQWLECLPVSSWLALVQPNQLDQPEIRRLIQDYCQDYHTLPLDCRRLQNSLGHMWGMSCLVRTDAGRNRANYQSFVLNGPSQAIRRTRSLLRRFAATNEPVLIYGESGTGREAAANFVHKDSSRPHQPLVAVNCAALPPSLTHSELFGHERGAFTHAIKARKGRIEAADGGTLLLIGADELNPEQQSAILRFLQEGQVEPVGSNQAINVDVRIIATSNTPLEALAREGKFRDDVLYRLGNLAITMPALRDRLEDLPYLIQRTLEICGSQKHWVDNATLLAMARHDWPGNLRELQNRLSQAVLLSQSLRLKPEELGLPQTSAPIQSEQFSLQAFRARADQEAISTSLSLTHQNISAAARLLQISRVSFYRLLEKHRVPSPSTHNSTKLNPHRGHGGPS